MAWYLISVSVQSVQLLSHVQLFATPRTEACQASLSFTISWSLLKLMSIELVMPSNHLILVVPLSSCFPSFPASGPFLMKLFASGGQSIGASSLVLPVNIQDWFPLGLTGLISLLFKRLSRIFSRTMVWMDPKKKKKWWEHVKNTQEPIWRSSRWQIIIDLSKKWLIVMGYNPWHK